MFTDVMVSLRVSTRHFHPIQIRPDWILRFETVRFTFLGCAIVTTMHMSIAANRARQPAIFRASLPRTLGEGTIKSLQKTRLFHHQGPFITLLNSSKSVHISLALSCRSVSSRSCTSGISSTTKKACNFHKTQYLPHQLTSFLPAKRLRSFTSSRPSTLHLSQTLPRQLNTKAGIMATSLQKQILREGDNTNYPKKGDIVIMEYTGRSTTFS